MRVEKGDGWEMRLGRWQDSPPDRCGHLVSDPPFTDHVSAHAAQRAGLASRQGAWVGGSGTGLSFGGVSPEAVARALEHVDRWSVIFCAIEQVGDYQRAAPDLYVRGGWWAKTNASPQFTGDRPAAPGEAVAIFHARGPKRWNRGGHKAEWRGPISHTGASPWDERIHETQKPLWLMAELVSAFTDPGDLVWDPYAGAATTGVACLLSGREFIGHEIQERYFEGSCRRLEAAARAQPLRDARAGQLGLEL